MMSSQTKSDTTIDVDTHFVKKLDLAETDGRYIAGYANIVDIIDNQDELVTRQALERAWEGYRKNPEYAFLMLQHQNISIAKVVLEEVIDSDGRVHRSGMDDVGLYLVAKIRDGGILCALRCT